MSNHEDHKGMLFLQQTFKDRSSLYNTCVTEYVYKSSVCELICGVLLLVPIAVRHHREASKPAICAIGITDTLYSYGTCLA